MLNKLFKIQIGIDRFNPDITALGDLESCWKIYWNFINSVQNIESDVWFECVDLHSLSNIDLSKGGNYPHMTDESWICVKKNHSYMIDRVKSLGFEINDDDDVKMIKIGITGGIGSGKSFVCNIFKCFGIPIFNSDENAKYLIETNIEVKNKIKEIFGDDIYLPIGVLDRTKLADIVFKKY